MHLGMKTAMRKFLSPQHNVSHICLSLVVDVLSKSVTARTLILEGETDHMFVPLGPDEFHNNTDYQINLNQYQ